MRPVKNQVVAGRDQIWTEVAYQTKTRLFAQVWGGVKDQVAGHVRGNLWSLVFTHLIVESLKESSP